MIKILSFVLFAGLFLCASGRAETPKLFAVFVIDSEAGTVGDDISPGCYANKNALLEVLNEIFSGERAGRFEHWVLDCRISKMGASRFPSWEPPPERSDDS